VTKVWNAWKSISLAMSCTTDITSPDNFGKKSYYPVEDEIIVTASLIESPECIHQSGHTLL
jgi:hypothetical protein